MRRALALVVVAMATAACGTPEGPVAIPRDELPFDLRRSPAAQGTPDPTSEVTVYFERRDRLARVDRSIPAIGSPVADAIRALLEGPTERERRRGMRTRIPPATRLLDVQVVEQIALLDFSAEFQEPAPPEVIRTRVAQVVYTAVRTAGVTAVRFAIDGTPVAVVTDSGDPVDRPVTPLDFATLEPAA